MHSPPRSQWNDEGGAIDRVCLFCNLDKHRHSYLINHVFSQALLSTNHYSNYSPARKKRIFNGEYLIPPNSVMEQLVADRIEEGCSVSITTMLLNQYREKEDLVHV